MIGFVIALPSEAKSFLEKIENAEKSTLLNKTLYTGKYLKEDVAIIISNIGKVSAALSTQALIDRFSPEVIFNFGTAGGVDGQCKTREFYYVESSAQYDLDLTAIDPVEIGYNQGYDRVFFDSLDLRTDLKKVKLVSSDRFTSTKEQIEIIKNMGATLYDMEGGAISPTCFSNGVPLIMIRAVSDVYGSRCNAEQFRENLSAIEKAFPTVIEKTLKTYLK